MLNIFHQHSPRFLHLALLQEPLGIFQTILAFYDHIWNYMALSFITKRCNYHKTSRLLCKECANVWQSEKFLTRPVFIP